MDLRSNQAMASKPPRPDDSAHPSEEQPDDQRRPWVSPRIEELPPLTELTLQTGDAIGGGGDTGGGGSTVF